jgi:hypothetical protein
LTLAWLGTAVAVTAATLVAINAGVGRYLSLTFVAQDLPVIAVATAVVVACRLGDGKAPAAFERNPRLVVAALAVGVTLLAILGGQLVLHGYPLSMDEFLARFDAQILRGGHLVAPVAPPFRDLLPALVSSFRLPIAGNAAWVSAYLPGNALLIALPGGAVWVPPALAGLAVVLAWAIARRLVPARPDTALTAALLLASSSQLIVMAMTTYAMTAHLALNLLWLWLVLVNRRWSHGAAAAVAWLATGLHQLIFHPLFAAPFVLSMWRERRWDVAIFHSLAYLAIGLFWAGYHPLALASEGLSGEGAGAGILVGTLYRLLTSFDLASFGLIAQNLLRFVAWQNPLMPALLILGARASWRAGGIRRDLLLGILLTLTVATVLMPAQGHGWGYRYLHSVLGNAALPAALSWDQRAGDGTDRDGGRRLVAISAALSLIVLLPIHLWQAHRFAVPYALSAARVARVDADYVLIDAGGIPYGTDLVRNDPWLRNRPKILDLSMLTSDQVRRLCTHTSIANFGTPEGLAAGMEPLVYVPPQLARNRRILAELGCDRRRVRMDAN